jgi:hypothetical protein
MAGRFICDRCGMTIPPHAHYVVKMSVYADPSVPSATSDEIEEADYERRTAELMKEMAGMSAQELEDSVHWEREFRICRGCQMRFIRDPLGSE